MNIVLQEVQQSSTHSKAPQLGCHSLVPNPVESTSDIQGNDEHLFPTVYRGAPFRRV
ncbi:hypothetical protein E2C01_088375 [Portunus trituberculatus]|uniref:Uncharacterized protein n=1 Tax=Portunus trituberculatus TaxID=210409 RepID=A0A5B7J607_PORTR|nr:hypothetical protein [Portunus trituberculatus]